MNNVVLMFPGQGSQYVGMGKELDSTPAHKYFKLADEVLGIGLSNICWNGPDSELVKTENTQPAILTHSIALSSLLIPHLANKNISIIKVLGHSVGEYAALVQAGALTFQDAVKAVHWRGKYMQEATPIGLGKMVAILRVPETLVQKACIYASDSEESVVMPANYNEPGQVVISGEAQACHRAVKWLESQVTEKWRAIELNVSAPFHCSLMRKAAIKMETILNNIEIFPLKIPYIANIDANEYSLSTTPSKIRFNLIEQICGSVLWTQSIQLLPPAVTLIEVGPGSILKGLVKKIRPELKVLSMNSLSALEELKETLN